MRAPTFNPGMISAAGGGASPTVVALTASSIFNGDASTSGPLKARDGNTSTNYTSTNGDAIWTLTIQLSAPAKIRYIKQLLRTDQPGFGMGAITLYHGSDGTTWNAGSDGSQTFPGSPGTAGATSFLTFNDDGAFTYYQIRGTTEMDGSALPNFISFVEIYFATDTAGTQLITGP